MSATRDWSYSGQGDGTPTLGDVQRLKNGHVLITYSTGGILVELDQAQNPVARVKIGNTLGYTMHRTSMYGPPDK